MAIAACSLTCAIGWLCLSMTLLPVADLPNHMARLFILSRIATEQQLAVYYQTFWHFQPNLALEGVAWLLEPFTDIYTMGRLLGVATYASLAIGLIALHRALHACFSSAALLPFVLIVNRYFIWGSLGYLIALGMAFVALAAWIACRDRPYARLTLGTVLATAVFFAHLYAFAVYTICIAGYECFLLWPRFHWREIVARGTVAIIQLLPAALLYFCFLTPIPPPHHAMAWRPLWEKAAGLVTLVPGYNYALEITIVALCFLPPLIAWLRGAAVFRGDLLVALIAFAVLYLVMPAEMCSGYGADSRLLVPLALLTLVCFDWRAGSVRARLLQWVLVGLVNIAHIGPLAIQWRSFERTYANLVSLTSLTELGASVAGAAVNASREYLPIPPLQEIVSLFVIDRSNFVPSLFVFPNSTSSPLRYTPAYAPVAVRLNVISALTKEAAQAKFDRLQPYMARGRIDYFLLIDDRRFALHVPENYQMIAQTEDGRSRLFRITN